MSRLPRRRLLHAGLLTVGLGTAGCLGVFDSYPTTDLRIVNAAAEPRAVVVRVTDAADRSLYHETHSAPVDESFDREAVVDTGPIEVSAHVEGEPGMARSETFDFAGCRAARVVLTVEDTVERVGKQDACRSGEALPE